MNKNLTNQSVFALLGVLLLSSNVAQAQIPPPPPTRAVDAAGMDLTSYNLSLGPIGSVSVGAKGNGLSRSDSSHSFPYGDSNFAGLSGIPAGPSHQAFLTAVFGDGSEKFNSNGQSMNGGSTLSCPNSSQCFVTRANGDLYEYNRTLVNQVGQAYDNGVLTKITRSNGEIVRFAYYSVVVSTGGTPPTVTVTSLKSVTSSMGWMLHYRNNASFASDIRHLSVQAINTAVDYCDPNGDPCTQLTKSWPTVSYVYTTELNRGRSQAVPVARVQDSLSRVNTYTYNSVIPAIPAGTTENPKTQPAAVTYWRTPLGVEKYVNYLGDLVFAPGVFNYIVPKKAITTSNVAFGKSFSLATQPTGHQSILELYLGTTSDPSGRTWTYTPTFYDSPQAVNSSSTMNLTVVDAAGNTTTTSAYLDWSQLRSLTDAVGFTASYDYLFPTVGGSVTKTSIVEAVHGTGSPDVSYQYDARFNITEYRVKAKSGSGLADQVTAASYDTACSNPKTCNKPNYIIDPRGKRTDFTYDPTHGGVLTETLPPDNSGIRPQKRYTYSQLTPMVKNSAGGLVSSDPAYLITQVSECLVGSSCIGTANEKRTTYAYAHNNLLMTSMTVAAGDNSVSAVTSYTYDDVGNVITEDGPLAGSVDATYFRYDAARQKVGVILPDPDGGGPLRRQAQRITYNSDGQVTLEETGWVSGVTDGDWAAFQSFKQVETAYDSFGMPATKSVKDNGTVIAVTQTSYDSMNRVKCVATRMNPAIYGGLPGDACTLGAPGSYGSDRIIRNTYDAGGRLTKVERAVGTSLQQDYARYTYAVNGKKLTEKDANGNLSDISYDGFDRVSRLQYPSTTPGAGASNAGDFETFGYDANNNRTSWRRRNGYTIGFTPDDLNREVFQDVPASPGNLNGTDRDLTTAYDLLGHIKSKQLGSGLAVFYGYDALGRLKSAQDVGSRLNLYDYNAASARSQMTLPGGSTLTYSLDNLNRVTLVTHSASTTLFGQGFDDLGRRTSFSRGPGSAAGSSGFGFDNVGRLTSMTNDLASTANDVGYTFAYSPAQQVVTLGTSSTVYDFKETASATTNRTFNGLNQDSAIAALGGGFDSSGNLANDGIRTMTYDVFNRLLSVSGGGASLQFDYDPEGRLYKYTSAGTPTYYNYDGANLIGEYSTQTTTTALRQYVHGAGVDEPVTWFEGSGYSDRRYFVKNYQGSVIAYTDSAGNLQQLYKYSPYGEPRDTNNNELWSGARFRYTGQTTLPEAKLYYYKARVYDPNFGRFLQTDPIGYQDDLNLYAYVGNDPLNASDPSGEVGELVWTANNKVTYTVRYTVVRQGANPGFTPAQVRAQVAKDFSGTVSVNGVNVQVTAQAIPMSKPNGHQLNTVTVVPDTAVVTASGRSQTDKIGGSQVTVGAKGVDAATAVTVSHELGGHAGGAGDQYKGGQDANGNTLGADVPGPANVMHDLSGGGANQQTLQEIIKAPTNTNKCAKGVTAANGGC